MIQKLAIKKLLVLVCLSGVISAGNLTHANAEASLETAKWQHYRGDRMNQSEIGTMSSRLHNHVKVVTVAEGSVAARSQYSCPSSNTLLSAIRITSWLDSPQKHTHFHLTPTKKGREAVRKAATLDFELRLPKWSDLNLKNFGKILGLNPFGSGGINPPSSYIIDFAFDNRNIYNDFVKEFEACRDAHPDATINRLLEAYRLAYPNVAERAEFKVRSWTSLHQQLYCHTVGEAVIQGRGGLTWDLEGHRATNYIILSWPLNTCNFGTYFGE